ncbi:MAG: serine hydrolase domain-containing protein [Bacteroidia bacterium]
MRQSTKLLLILLFNMSAYMSAQQLSPTQTLTIDSIFQAWDKTNSPGCALAVIKDGEIAYSRGYGMADLEHGLAINPRTVFYIGSVSKQFVAMCMLLLAEDGQISLDDDIHKYFPQLPDYGYPISIRNLIHHTSGIRDYLQLWEMSGRSYLDKVPEKEALEIICRQKNLNFEPGTRYLYSNSCYFMMALIVRKVTGKNLREYAQERIFGPLGMTSTQYYDDNRRLIPNRAFGYGEPVNGTFANMMMRFDLVGSGGIYSTVEDLYKWDQNFYHNQIGKQGQALIDQMLTNGRYKDGTELNYAFALENGKYKGLRTISHGGALGGYRSGFLQFPDQRVSVIILSNLETFDPMGIAHEVADVVLEKNFLPEVPVYQPKPISLSIEKLKAYTGFYWNDWDGNSREIVLRDGVLYYNRGGQSESVLTPVGEGKFIMGADAAAITTVIFFDDHLEVIQGQEQPTVLTRYEPFIPTEKDLITYAGKYYAADIKDTVELVALENKLQLVLADGQKLPLLPAMKDQFYHPYMGSMRFTRKNAKAVEGFTLDAGRVRNVWFGRGN